MSYALCSTTGPKRANLMTLAARKFARRLRSVAYAAPRQPDAWVFNGAMDAHLQVDAAVLPLRLRQGRRGLRLQLREPCRQLCGDFSGGRLTARHLQPSLRFLRQDQAATITTSATESNLAGCFAQ